MTETVQRYSRDDGASLLVPHLRVGERAIHMPGGNGKTHPVRWARTGCGIDIYHTLAGELSTADREHTRCQECYDATVPDQAGT